MPHAAWRVLLTDTLPYEGCMPSSSTTTKGALLDKNPPEGNIRDEQLLEEVLQGHTKPERMLGHQWSSHQDAMNIPPSQPTSNPAKAWSPQPLTLGEGVSPMSWSCCCGLHSRLYHWAAPAAPTCKKNKIMRQVILTGTKKIQRAAPGGSGSPAPHILGIPTFI